MPAITDLTSLTAAAETSARAMYAATGEHYDDVDALLRMDEGISDAAVTLVADYGRTRVRLAIDDGIAAAKG